MITYLIIGITVVLSFICFSNRELFMKSHIVRSGIMNIIVS